MGVNNRKSIKYFVNRFLRREADRFRGKTVVDCPAGNGFATEILLEIGAKPLAYDLFPEHFEVDGVTCHQADIAKGLPLEDGSVDALLCVEGFEHFTDQYRTLGEFARVLKKGGSLILTTPNYSNLCSRVSYLLGESEYFSKQMPPNELDSVWLSDRESDREPYFGHIFLIGIQKLRTLALLNGFALKHIEPNRIRTTPALFFPFLYPLIWFTQWRVYRRNMRKNTQFDKETREQVYGELFRLGTDPRILLDSTLFVELVKVKEKSEAHEDIHNLHAEVLA